VDNVTIIDAPQRSPEWFAARLGCLTASCLGDAFAKTKSGYAASRRNLAMRLVLERITGRSQESGYTNADMQRGIELEPDALSRYELEHDAIVNQVGFLRHNTLMTGCSPDGMVGADGLIEIKAPKPAIHLDYIRGGLPEAYRLQMVHALWLTGRQWCDFVSYCPDFPESLQLRVMRLLASSVDFGEHAANVEAFLTEVDREEAAVRALAATA